MKLLKIQGQVCFISITNISKGLIYVFHKISKNWASDDYDLYQPQKKINLDLLLLS